MAAPSTSLSIQHAARLLTEGRIAEATEHLEALVARLPAYVTAYVLLARAYETAGRLDDALAAWHHAHFLMPGSPLVHRQRRRLLRRLAEPVPEGRGTEDDTARRGAPHPPQPEDEAADVIREDAPHPPQPEDEAADVIRDAPPERPSEPEPEDEADIVTAEIRPPTASAPAAAPPPEGDDENGWRVLDEHEASDEPDHLHEPDFLHPAEAPAFDAPRFEEPSFDEPGLDRDDSQAPAPSDEADDDPWGVPHARSQHAEPGEDEAHVAEPDEAEPFATEPSAAEPAAPAPPAAAWVDDIEDPLGYAAPPQEPDDFEPDDIESEDGEPESEFADLDFGAFSLPSDLGGSFEDDFGAPTETREPAAAPGFELSLLDSVDDLDSLIEQLENAPRITPNTPLTEDTDDPDPFGAGELVSETLARIYETQQQFAHAARAYDRLADQHPERAAEFRERAEAMRRRADA